ncbi:MAG TPA: S8 family peptidase [Oculatellaceae cyanobacterium]|jgi:thermitase
MKKLHHLLINTKAIFLLLGLPVGLFVFSQAKPSLANTPASSTNSSTSAEYVPGTVVVKFKNITDEGSRKSVLLANGLIKKKVIWGTDVVVAQGKGKSTEALIKALSNHPFIEYVEPDYIAKATWTPNDSSFTNQWGLKKVSAESAWDKTKGSSSVKIAIIDTGVDLNHPDLSAKVITDSDYDFVNSDYEAQDDQGHGTHVAGIAAAATNNGTGIAGMCPDCSILPIKVLDSTGSGSFSNIASAIRYATDKGAKVINLSLGGGSSSTTLLNAVRYAHSKGVLLACAAGNANTSKASYPAYYSECVAVAATDQNDYKASFSNYGSWVDTSAPGVNIDATYWNDTYAQLNGTSMATPYVAGLAGMLFSQGLTQTNVRTRLTGLNYTDSVNSSGIARRINAHKAVSN